MKLACAKAKTINDGTAILSSLPVLYIFSQEN